MINLIFTAIRRLVCHFSFAFSGIILFFWTLMKETSYINYDKISVFFWFSVIFGVTSLIFSIPKIPTFIKTVLHLILNTAAFVFTFGAVDGTTEARAFVAGAFFVLLYVIIALAIFLLKKLSQRLSEKKEETTEEE